MSNSNKESWNNHAERFYIAGHLEGDLPLDYVDFCGNVFPSDKDLNIIGEVGGLKVLEIGSGSCNCGIALAKKGADVTCLDISSEQLKIGQQVAKKEGVNLRPIESDMTDLSSVEADSMDLTISMSAIMYVEDINKVFQEVNRVLKHQGRFIFSTNHPFIMCLGATELWPEEEASPSYDYRGAVEFNWKKEDTFYFTIYRWPLMDYVNGLARNGFCINRMEELLPKQADPKWSEQEKRIRMRYPSVLVVEAIKME